jgi:exopolysaccharide production protein ExoY
MRNIDGGLADQIVRGDEGDARSGLYARRVKRALDILLVVISAPIALAIIVPAWIIARLDGGPGLYGHRRIGRDGRGFVCWKIRTMHGDADARLALLLAADLAAARDWDARRKLDCDPRVTRAGRLMRRLSIDELPQLWNVLRGEMSIVGPRPVTAEELALYGTRRHYYLACRPGVTGLWQVSGRNRLSYEERVALDQRYAEGIGLMRDIGLMLRTVLEVLRMSGS